MQVVIEVVDYKARPELLSLQALLDRQLQLPNTAQYIQYSTGCILLQGMMLTCRL